jgi:hypothetical protein
MNLDCWSYDGTSATACINNTRGITCTWTNVYNASSWDYPCVGPPEKQCWDKQNQTSCEATVGCEWGMCEKESCWEQTTAAECALSTGFNGKVCQWKSYSWGSECTEQGCWYYTNRTDCNANGCKWDGSCMESSCSDFSGQNATYCVNNTANKTCSFDETTNWCQDKGCWNFNDQTNCNNATGCFWETYTGGWCQEMGCWNWQGNQSACTNTTIHPGLNCVYDAAGGWCFENVSAKSCADITVQRECMDTFYCWWNVTASSCNDPVVGQFETDFVAWNPGCYIFDTDQTLCQNTTGCYWFAFEGTCDDNITVIRDGQLNCSLLNNQTTCNSIPTLSTCCKWQGNSCVADRFDQSCRQQMQEPPEGAYYCEDYNAYTNNATCLQIAGSPWFMPCKWNNVTERCEFKGDKVFGTGGESNLMLIDNQQNCEAAGGQWILDTYPSGDDPNTAVQLSMGRCDYKFDEERNCNKECFACEYKTDKTNWSSLSKAKTSCKESELGICTFIEEDNAPNGYGFCEPKPEFKKGIIKNSCDNDCAACTYMGDPTASDGYRPSDFCLESNANCQWVADPANPDDESRGICVSGSEKICEQRCDKCYEESICAQYGGKNGNETAATVCEWSSGMCTYKSGASQMEICWDGIDNNGDNKMDCADSQCMTDPFCGGGFMFDSFGIDCFMYTDNASCVGADCAWVTENWGSWCDMPMATCWKKDGTNESYCEDDGVANITCEWHSGFGGMCEADFNMGGMTNTCMNYDKTTCSNATGASKNCTWVQDSWCQDSGGWCTSDPAYTGAWYDCPQHSMNGSVVCESHAQCNWNIDLWCASQGTNAGHCDHQSFACWQFDDNPTMCQDTTNTTYNHSQWCTWVNDQYSPNGGRCDGKMMAGAGSTDGCWNQQNQTACTQSGCNWISGLCDPKGFGGENMMGMSGGGTPMGGYGMQCFIYNGNQTLCEAQTGCGWFDEPWPFCDINFESNCPQYSYSEAACRNTTLTGDRCKWNAQQSFCDEKPFECHWNTTLANNATACNQNPLCLFTNGHCEPIGMSSTNRAQCLSHNATFFRWITGWCDPAMAAQFFKGMDVGGPPIPLGTDPDDVGIENEVDILGFGMKDMGQAFGFGITVDDIANAAACNDATVNNQKLTGTNTTTFYWYFDTDGNKTNNCAARHNSTDRGYEFYIKKQWSYDSSSGSVTESPTAYRCSDGSWIVAEIKVSSQKQMMCNIVGGVMIGVEKIDFEKFPSLYVSGQDLRISVASANASANSTNPTDSVAPEWVTPGSQDFDVYDLYDYENDPVKKAMKEGMDEGFIHYSQDADCWTEDGCDDYACKDHPFCVENNYGVEADDFEDTRTPKVKGVIKETYVDSAFFAYFTDQPANGTINFYRNDSKCSTLNISVPDPGVTDDNVREFKLWHLGELFSENLGYNLANGTMYYYKIKVCDETGKCGESKCSNFTTAGSLNGCPFCEFVSRIDVPSGWNVFYDMDTDNNYTHWQGNVLGEQDGIYTNYSIGRRVNIKINTTDGSSYLEFFNATLTKSAMGPTIRDNNGEEDFRDGTNGSIGYVGMIETVRDKIIFNYYPRICHIKIPSQGTCTELWQCDADGDTCIDRTASATSIQNGTDYCVWKIPYCEFSVWAGGDLGGGGSGTTSTSSGGGGGGSSGAAANQKIVVGESGQRTTLTVKRNERFDFVVDGVAYTYKVDTITGALVKIKDTKTLTTAYLFKGVAKRMDIDGNGKDDVSVNVIGITGGSAVLEIESLLAKAPVRELPTPIATKEAAAETTGSEAATAVVPVEQATAPATEQGAGEAAAEPEGSETGTDSFLSQISGTTLFIVIAAVVLAVLLVVLFVVLRGKKE